MKFLIAFILSLITITAFATEARRVQPRFDPDSECAVQIDESSVFFAVDSIKKYLENSPRALDTAEGIHSWWIDWPSTPPDISITLMALEVLEKNGFVEKRRMGSKIIWRKFQPKKKEAIDQ